jgi:Predicted transcriptional regulators
MTEIKAFTRLRALRAERELTQGDMAEVMGISKATYQKKENGERDFTLPEIARAKEKLQIDVDYYFFYLFTPQLSTTPDPA